MKISIVVYLTILLLTSCTRSFNPSEELNRIDNIINRSEVDSVSGHDSDDNNYKYWIEDGIIIKLAISSGNYECVFNEEYYFEKDGGVFANKKSEFCPPNGTDYKSLIIFDSSIVITEEYWLSENKVSKSEMKERLLLSGYSIEEDIIKDYDTKKSKGTLNIKYFAERFNLKIPGREEEKILFFEDEYQTGSFKFIFKGNKVDILYKYATHASPIVKAELKDGKIITEYGHSDIYVISYNRLCKPNPETDEYDCYEFVRSKSTHEIDEVMTP